MLFYESLGLYVKGQKQKLDRLKDANIPERGLVLKVLSPKENQDKEGDVVGYSQTHETDFIELDYAGINGHRHRGHFRNSGAREKSLYPKRTPIRQQRHVFTVSPYDCKVLSELLNVEVTPELLGANLVIGRENGGDYSLSALPENTHLLIAPENSVKLPRPPIATLVRYALQHGCGVTGNLIASTYGERNLTKKFVDISKNNRGIVCSVEYPVEQFATIKPGQVVFFKFPMGIAPK